MYEDERRRLQRIAERVVTYLKPFFPTLLLASLVAALWYCRTKSTASRRLLWASLAAVVLFSWPPVAWVASGTLEWGYSADPFPYAPAEAIVVLSGSVIDADGVPPMRLPGKDTYLRCAHAAWLYQNWRTIPVVASGGDGTADVMKEALLGLGVARSDIRLEGTSTSTHENAVHTAALLRQEGIHKIALVTEAHHMLRAEACFRKQGLEVVPAPCGFRSQMHPIELADFLPSGTAIKHNEEVLHEWMGSLWYLARGRL
jgi:uncharacterized SAM-binding protein YcdF (DUF218 family)